MKRATLLFKKLVWKTSKLSPKDLKMLSSSLGTLDLPSGFCFSTASLNSSLSDRASPGHQHSFAELLICAGARKSTQATNTHKEELARDQCKKHFEDTPWSPWPFVDSILGRTTVREEELILFSSSLRGFLPMSASYPLLWEAHGRGRKWEIRLSLRAELYQGDNSRAVLPSRPQFLKAARPPNTSLLSRNKGIKAWAVKDIPDSSNIEIDFFFLF